MKIVVLLFVLSSQEASPDFYFNQGQDQEFKNKDYVKAIERYNLCLKRAKELSNKEYAIRALLAMARCAETFEEPNLSQAADNFKQLVDGYPDAKEKPFAEEKLKLKGVDVYLDRFRKLLAEWRRKTPTNFKLLTERKTFIWEKIKPMGKDSIYGLIRALEDDDEMIKNFAGDKLLEVIDQDGINMLMDQIIKSGKKRGAIRALGWILQIYQEVYSLRAEAKDLKTLTQLIFGAGTSKGIAQAEAFKTKYEAKANDLLKRANEIKYNMPEDIDLAKALEILLDVIKNDKENVVKAEAYRALQYISDLKGDTIVYLMDGLNSDSADIREGACMAASSVAFDEKSKIVDRLIYIVNMEPEKQDKSEKLDLANTVTVREKAAQALGNLFVTKSVPNLIKAIEDDSPSVRKAAFESLKRITGKEKNFHERAPLDMRDPLFPEVLSRKEVMTEYTTLWNRARGVDFILAKFTRIVEIWEPFRPEKLFHEDFFMYLIRTSELYYAEPQRPLDFQKTMDRAKLTFEKFKEKRVRWKEEMMFLEKETVEFLLDYLKGVPPDAEKENPGLRVFVADCIATIINQKRDDALLFKVKEMLNSESEALVAGAAYVLSMVSKDMISEEDVKTMVSKLDKGNEVREAVIIALTMVGKTVAEKDLAAFITKDLKQTKETEAYLKKIAVNAFGKIEPKDKEAIDSIGRLLLPKGTKDSNGKELGTEDSYLVRDEICRALGNVDPDLSLSHLLVGCRDKNIHVKKTAFASLNKMVQAKPELVDKIKPFLSSKDQIRVAGAIVALAHRGDPGLIKNYIDQLKEYLKQRSVKKDETKDREGELLRAAVAEACGILKIKDKDVLLMLFDLLIDDFLPVRYFAYDALKNILGKDEVEAVTVRIRVLTYKCKDCGEQFELSEVTGGGCTKCHSKKFEKILNSDGTPKYEEKAKPYDPSYHIRDLESFRTQMYSLQNEKPK